MKHDLAQIAYEAYSRSRETHEGSWLPDWKHLEPRTREAWLAAANAVKVDMLSRFTRVGEGESVQDT
jgi:hypothetical protein